MHSAQAGDGERRPRAGSPGRWGPALLPALLKLQEMNLIEEMAPYDVQVLLCEYKRHRDGYSSPFLYGRKKLNDQTGGCPSC